MSKKHIAVVGGRLSVKDSEYKYYDVSDGKVPLGVKLDKIVTVDSEGKEVDLVKVISRLANKNVRQLTPAMEIQTIVNEFVSSVCKEFPKMNGSKKMFEENDQILHDKITLIFMLAELLCDKINVVDLQKKDKN